MNTFLARPDSLLSKEEYKVKKDQYQQYLKKILALLMLSISCLSLTSQALTIELEANQWTLISFDKLPEDSTVDSIFGDAAESGVLTDLWTFDNERQQWNRWPSYSPLLNTNLNELEPGVGYWARVSENMTLELPDDAVFSNDATLFPGWNLIGFPVPDPTRHDVILSDVPFTQLWRFNEDIGAFELIEKNSTGDVTTEQFTDIEPGRAYWVFAEEQVSVNPELELWLPSDIDKEPLLNITQYGEEVVWNELTPGDVDWDQDGMYDFPNTQSTLGFGDFLSKQKITITNKGNGFLAWQVELLDPSVDWLFFESFDEEGTPVYTTGVEGSLSQGNGELVFVVDRSGLAPGEYSTSVRFSANGNIPERIVDVTMTVSDIVGDYEVIVNLQRIDGKKADLHNPTYYLSFARDGGSGIRAFLDAHRSLLVSENVAMAGQYENDPLSSFHVTGQIHLPDNHEHNPFSQEITRELTFVGHRSNGSDGLSPLDLRGEFYETITGITGELTQIKGVFVATRLSPNPKAQDEISNNDRVSGNISANTTSVFTYEVSENLDITDVDVHLDVVHNNSEELTISLVSPSNRRVILHDRQDRILQNITFSDEESIQSLEAFNGLSSQGEWRLEIINHGPSIGTVNQFSLDIFGGHQYEIRGRLEPNVTVQLSGCGITRTTTTDAQGNFVFSDLIPCNYTIQILGFGYADASINVRVGDSSSDCSNTSCPDDYYVVTLTDEQADALSPQVDSDNPGIRLVPSQSTLPVTLQAVDSQFVTNSSNPINSKTWELHRLENGGSSVVVDSMNSLDELWAYELTVESEPGIYFLRVTANVGGGVGVMTSTSNQVVVNRRSEGVVHFGLISHQAMGGSTTVKAMDSATFDIDRPRITGSYGIEDSDGFSNRINTATGTNAALDHSASTPRVIDPALGDPSKHYRLYSSVGQAMHTPTFYGDDYTFVSGVHHDDEFTSSVSVAVLMSILSILL